MQRHDSWYVGELYTELLYPTVCVWCWSMPIFWAHWCSYNGMELFEENPGGGGGGGLWGGKGHVWASSRAPKSPAPCTWERPVCSGQPCAQGTQHTHAPTIAPIVDRIFFVGLDEPLEMSIMVFVIDVAWRRFSNAASCIFNTLKM